MAVVKKRSVLAPLVLAGVSGAALASGVVFGLRAKRQADASHQAFYASDIKASADAARSSEIVANVSYGAALAAALAAGAVYLLTPGAAGEAAGGVK